MLSFHTKSKERGSSLETIEEGAIPSRTDYASTSLPGESTKSKAARGSDIKSAFFLPAVHSQARGKEGSFGKASD